MNNEEKKIKCLEMVQKVYPFAFALSPDPEDIFLAMIKTIKEVMYYPLNEESLEEKFFELTFKKIKANLKVSKNQNSFYLLSLEQRAAVFLRQKENFKIEKIMNIMQDKKERILFYVLAGEELLKLSPEVGEYDVLCA